MRLRCGVVCVLLLCALKVQAQTTMLDSLLAPYASLGKDSLYIDKLNTVASSHLNSNPAITRKIAFYTSDLSSKKNYLRGYARALTVIGNAYWYEGIYEFAQNYYLLAARQYQSLNDSIGLGQVYNNIGEVNKRFGDHDKSLDYLLQSLALRKKDTTLALTLHNIGELYLVKGELSEASKYINHAMNMARKNNDERVITYCHWSIARIKTAEGKFNEAIPYFQLAEERWKKSSETRSLIETYHDMAEGYRKQNHLEKANKYLDEAYALGKKIALADLRVKTYHGYSKLDSSRGDFQKSLYYLSLHNALKDSVYNLLKAEQIARVQVVYETERRQRENDHLRGDKKLKDQQLRSKEGLIGAITAGLVLVAILAVVLFQQRGQILNANKSLQDKNAEISFQKEAIEVQSVALLKLNEELHDLNKTLEERIEDRSKQLLLQNQKLADYAFVNAHKLRAPVASIIGLIQLIHQANPDEREEIIAHLKTCALQLDSVIQEISRNLESDF